MNNKTYMGRFYYYGTSTHILPSVLSKELQRYFCSFVSLGGHLIYTPRTHVVGQILQLKMDDR